MACKGSRPGSPSIPCPVARAVSGREGLEHRWCPLPSSSVLTGTGRSSGASNVCRIALVSKETVVVRVQLLELRQVLRWPIP